MGLLPDTQNWGLRMRRECWERFSHHRLQRKPLVSDPGMHRGTCVTHVSWCMPGSLTRGGGENVPGACPTRNFTYLARGPCGVIGLPGWQVDHRKHQLFSGNYPAHNSHSARVPYPTIHNCVTEICRCMHNSVTKWYIVRYLSDALWDW